MKRIFSLLAALTLLVSAGYAQTTNTPPVVITNSPSSTLWDFLTTGSNYWATPFATYGVNSRDFGGGIALGYRVSDIVNPVVRVDYFASKFYLVSVNAEVQVPRSLMGKIPIVPFVIGGVGTGLSGLGSDNGTAIGIVGSGAYSALDYVGKGWFWQHTAVIADYERWVGLPTAQADQVRFGVLIHF